MNRFKLILFIILIAGSCGQAYKVTTESMSDTFNPGQILKLKNKTSFNRGDVVFFKRDHNPGQVKETWLFRVIAFSGDTIEIKNGDVTVNSKLTGLPENARLQYIITASSPLDLKRYRDKMINQISENRYIAFLTMKEYTEVSRFPGIAISRIINTPGSPLKGIVRNDFTDNWNEDQFGPLYIPGSGEKIKITQANHGLYNDILPDLQPDSTVTIKEKLYFLMGDNRSNASDSRFIGFIPESNILGYVEVKP